jgi:hypothetical protein
MEGVARASGGRHGTRDGGDRSGECGGSGQQRGNGVTSGHAGGGAATGRVRRRRNKGAGGLPTWAATVGARNRPRAATTGRVAGEDEAWATAAAAQRRRRMGGRGRRRWGN